MAREHLGQLTSLHVREGEAVSLQVLATWKARDGVKLVFPLLGATGEDAVVTLNPQAGGCGDEC